MENWIFNYNSDNFDFGGGEEFIEVANFAALPVTGESGIIYVTLDTNKLYRWTGSTYVEISASVSPVWGGITGSLINQTDLQNALNLKQNSLGYTAENVANKENSTIDTSTTKYPTVNLLKTGLDSKQETLVSGTNIKTINGNSVLGTGDLVVGGGGGVIVGTTAITSGTVGRILFQGSGDVVQQDSTLFWDNTNKRLGIGATPSTSVRLDVRAQGVLSTDIAFRVRNSVNTQNLIEILGSGRYRLGDEVGGLSNAFSYLADGRLFMAKSGTNFIELNNSLINRFYNPTAGWEITGNTTIATQTVSGSGGSGSWHFFAGTLQIGVLAQTSGASNSIWMSNGTAPTVNFADRHWYYSADITAGNAAPHFRTENGNVIKLYRETTGIAAGAFVANTSEIANDTATYGGYTMGQVVAALKAQGLLA
jgi:hypothetical protein